MPRLRPLYSLLPLLLLLSACTLLGLEQAKTLNDRIAYVTASVDAVVVSATNALNAHAIKSDDAQFVATTARNVSALVAAAAEDPDPASAEGRVKLAEGVLRQLQTYLATHQKAKP